MITNFKKRTAYTIGAIILGCIALSPNLAIAQTASNITGTWELLRGDTQGLGGSNPFLLKINHNTSTNVIAGIIYNTSTSPGQCIKGFYLPSSRRLSFVRTSNTDCASPIIQYYEGWVYPGGKTLNATYHVWDYSGSNFSLPGTGLDYPISAIKRSETP